MAKCKSCGAEIRWIKMESGKMMPVDAEQLICRVELSPDQFAFEQEVDICITEDGTVQRGIVAPKLKCDMNQALIGPVYRPHWATCPFANEYRRKKNEPSDM